jgi:hypothetical protein
MGRSVRIAGAALIALTLASSAASAQTANPTLHARAAHHAKKPKPQPEGRQITVHKATPSWLTLGTEAPVGYGNNYVTDTFAQPSPIEGTFLGMRGRERLGTQFDGPGVPLIRF